MAIDLLNELSDIPMASKLPKLSSDAFQLPDPPDISLPNKAKISQEMESALSGTSSRSAINSSTPKSFIEPALTTVDFQMTLISKGNPEDQVVFKVSPTIDESRSANYDHMTPVHHPGSIQVYKSTEARTFNISAKLISRTAEEASENINNLNLIRSWVMPYYGQGTANSALKEKLGAPPDILIFDVYGIKNIADLPVVLTSYHWVYPDNVEYIPSTEGIPFPVIIDITLALVEAYSPEEYTGFDITKYKTGDMIGAYVFSAPPSN